MTNGEIKKPRENFRFLLGVGFVQCFLIAIDTKRNMTESPAIVLSLLLTGKVF